MIKQKILFGAAALALTLSACSVFSGGDDKTPLPGERLSVMQLQQKLEPDQAAAAKPFTAPAPWVNEAWPLAGGYANHAMQNLALNPEALNKKWSADIGAGASATIPLTAQPVVAGGRVFTLDSQGMASAFDAQDGTKIWRVDTTPQNEGDTAIGGGVGAGENAVFVTNGYAELLALNIDTGAEIWRAKLPAPARSAPSILDGRVYAATIDNRLIALDSKEGTIAWAYRGVSEGARLLGGASPAVNSDLVVCAFSSGDIAAFRTQNGALAWSDNLAPVLRLGGMAGLSDIRALPVLDNGIVIAVSYAGRLAAIDARTGNRVWQRDIGGQETPVIAGSYLFILSTAGELISLERETGVIRWILPLDRFKDMKTHTGPLVWTGPIYAGGRLIVMGTDGRALDINPATGDILRDWKTGGTPAAAPIVAREMLYTLDQNGTLSAWK